ncbi:hypothetical protein FCH28_30995 [Streptomyces piniterrae]|uniref:Uncharacterized protein n=1 Tax=Streptomyces piniterrae TaxID=2571125 RepID=A0A4U0N377_9ACTN|nr:hypothetical protein [Streptomyces piniterrae]TJZ44044.1 hypothetical protein FCH28_30995 [Streptomyces piniterrae]
MGWHTSALFVRDRSIDDVVGFLPDTFAYEPTSERAGGDWAWGSDPGERLYFAERGGWAQLWDPDCLFVPRLESLIATDGPGPLRETQALAVTFSDVAFSLYDDAELVRHVAFHGWETVADHGPPLPVEGRIALPSWGPDEGFLWSVIEEVTGVEGDFDQLFEVYDVVMA